MLEVFFCKYLILFFNILSSMGIGDWGLGIGDWGLGPIPNPHQSPIPNPQSPILHLFLSIKLISKKII
jgi:hypothetical protein